jgi:hypothetical protein
MPSITFTSPGPIVANIHLDPDSTPIVAVAPLDDPAGWATVEVGAIEVTARLHGPVDALELALEEALDELKRRFP